MGSNQMGFGPNFRIFITGAFWITGKDILQETEELIKIFVTSIKTAEKKIK
jgi:hypothetical protein